MCTPIVGQLTETLVQSYIEDGFGVSFKGQGSKWDTEDHVKDVVARIGACDKMKYLELEGNTLGVDAAKAIAKALESKQEFEAALWRDLFTSRLKNEIPQAMRFLFAGVNLAAARLQYLDLSDNAIGPLGMTGLAPFFKCSSSFSLKVLICNNNGLGPQGAEEFSKALINCRQLSFDQGGEVFNLKTFVCGRNRMQNKGALAIAKFIKECTSLEEIHMPENSVYWQGQCALAEAFAKNPKLRVINLNDNTITGKGTKKLAQTFQDLVNLEELNLGDCLLKGSGALIIVNAVRNHPQLRKLVLDGNEIIKPMGIEIAEILRNSRSLRHLSMSSNPFGVEGSEKITALLRECETVEIEDVEDSEYEEEENEEEVADSEEEDEEEVHTKESGEIEDESREVHEDDDDYENYEDYGGEEYEPSDGDEDALDKIAIFLHESSLENYQSIPLGVPEYVYDLQYMGTPYEICIQAAFSLIDYYGKDSLHVPQECEDIFSKLLSEASNFANPGSDEFATTLLYHLGVLQAPGEEYYRSEICNPLLESLSLWLINVAKEEDTVVSERMLLLLKNEFQNVRSDLAVDKSKLGSLVDYVLWRRKQNAG